MSRQYQIWINVKACIYGSAKSYGAKDVNEQTILVGSSSGNSHELATILNYKLIRDDVIIFRTKVDGIIIKEITFENNNGKAGKLLKKRNGLARVKGL